MYNQTRVTQNGRGQAGRRFSDSPNWQTVLIGLVTALLLGGVVACSPSAFALAEEGRDAVVGSASQTKKTTIENGEVIQEEVVTAERTMPMTLAEAQAQVDFAIRLPTYLPAGYTERNLDPAPHGDAVLVQYQTHPSNPRREFFELYETIGQGEYGGGEAVREVQIDGNPARWIEDRSTTYDEAGSPSPLIAHKLTWTADGIHFTLRSYTLSLEQMIRIAESLQ